MKDVDAAQGTWEFGFGTSAFGRIIENKVKETSTGKIDYKSSRMIISVQNNYKVGPDYFRELPVELIFHVMRSTKGALNNGYYANSHFESLTDFRPSDGVMIHYIIGSDKRGAYRLYLDYIELCYRR